MQKRGNEPTLFEAIHVFDYVNIEQKIERESWTAIANVEVDKKYL